MNYRLVIIAIAFALGSCTNQVEPPNNLVDADCVACVDACAECDSGDGEDMSACDGCSAACTECVEVSSLFVTPPFEHCAFASPLFHDGANGPEILAYGGGAVVGLAPRTGEELWRVDVPTGDNQNAVIVATPALVDNLLVLEYHTRENDASAREAHFVLVIDVDARAIAEDFERLEVTGTFDANDGETVPFRSQNALGRAEIAHARSAGSTLGRVYVTYGNARDIQPWHGFAFEIDLDVWKADGTAAAVTGSLITTPEADCGPSGVSGSYERICGGGLWSPSGSLIVERGDSYEVILPPGNGQLDLNRDDFANTLMRVGPGLEFDPACDETLCADFDSDEPATACVETCQNLFVPRDDVGDPFPLPESGNCDGLTMYECWAKRDYIGGSTPVHLALDSGTEVLAFPTKDGSVYLVDADHLGTLYDREQLVAPCGTPDDDCRWNWAGMIVTQPAIVTTAERPTILVPTFMPDKTHPAGVVALAIDESSGSPQFERLWSVPDFEDDAAIERFREHSTRIGMQLHNGREIAWIGESLRAGTSRLLAIDALDGSVLVDAPVSGSGMRFTQPLIVDDVLYLNHCDRDDAGRIEGIQIEFGGG